MWRTMSTSETPPSRDPDPSSVESQPDPSTSTPRDAYATYVPPWRLLLLEVIAFLLIALVCGMSPDSGHGASAIIRVSSGPEYVGVLRESNWEQRFLGIHADRVGSCTGGKCDGWLAGAPYSALLPTKLTEIQVALRVVAAPPVPTPAPHPPPRLPNAPSIPAPTPSIP